MTKITDAMRATVNRAIIEEYIMLHGRYMIVNIYDKQKKTMKQEKVDMRSLLK